MAYPKLLSSFPLLLFLISIGVCNCIIQTRNNTVTRNHKGSGGFSLRMIHRDSPDSPTYRANLTKAERMRENIRSSKLRLESLARSVSKRANANNDVNDNKTRVNDDPILRPQITIQDPAYIIEAKIGTFDSDPSHRSYYLVFDTGSDITWTQCEGCGNCFHQTYPYFNPSESHTYLQTPCYHCPRTAICDQNTCRLELNYGDGTYAKVILAQDSFFFDSENGLIEVAGFSFGCGMDMVNFIAGNNPNNKISGILGMSYGEYSLVDQAEYITHGEFSYCLQPIDQHPDMSPMFLRFGNDIIDPPHPYHTTHLFQNGENEHYHLDLRGIMIDADEVHFPRGVFDIKRDGSGGFVIDSGASATVLTTVAYHIFKEAMASYLESHNSNLERFSREEYDLCYKRVRDPEGVDLPHVTFEFANDADFEMEPERVFEISHDGGDGKPLICLYIFEAPASTNGMSVLGVYQQVNHRIVYDVHDGKLHFGLDDCSHAN